MPSPNPPALLLFPACDLWSLRTEQWKADMNAERYTHTPTGTNHSFYFRYWFIQICKIQMQSSLGEGGSSIPNLVRLPLKEGASSPLLQPGAPSPGEGGWLDGCSGDATVVWSQQRCCSSNLNSLSKVTSILNKDTEIIDFLVWFIV